MKRATPKINAGQQLRPFTEIARLLFQRTGHRISACQVRQICREAERKIARAHPELQLLENRHG